MQKKNRRGESAFRMVPYDCWSQVILFFCKPENLKSLQLCVPGLFEYLKSMNPKCTRNVEFCLRSLPNQIIKHVSNLKCVNEKNDEISQFLLDRGCKETNSLIDRILVLFPNLVNLHLSLVNTDSPGDYRSKEFGRKSNRNLRHVEMKRKLSHTFLEEMSLYLFNCPRFSINETMFPNLRTLKLVNIEKKKYIYQGEGNNRKFNLKRLKWSYLPQLRNLILLGWTMNKELFNDWEKAPRMKVEPSGVELDCLHLGSIFCGWGPSGIELLPKVKTLTFEEKAVMGMGGTYSYWWNGHVATEAKKDFLKVIENLRFRTAAEYRKLYSKKTYQLLESGEKAVSFRSWAQHIGKNLRTLEMIGTHHPKENISRLRVYEDSLSINDFPKLEEITLRHLGPLLEVKLLSTPNLRKLEVIECKSIEFLECCQNIEILKLSKIKGDEENETNFSLQPILSTFKFERNRRQGNENRRNDLSALRLPEASKSSLTIPTWSDRKLPRIGSCSLSPEFRDASLERSKITNDGVSPPFRTRSFEFLSRSPGDTNQTPRDRNIAGRVLDVWRPTFEPNSPNPPR